MEIFGKTHIGKVRQINQDYFLISREPIGKLDNLFIIADGMGGHKAGEIAAKLAVQSFIEFCEKTSEPSIEEIFIKAIGYANNTIYEKSIHTLEMSGMGTTMVACTIYDDILYIANVGDSRLYVIEDVIKQITIDHSYVEELVRMGEISREESINHPAKNKITRALGIEPDIDVDLFKLNTGNIKEVLLCSDGLTNMVTDSTIEKVLKSGDSLEIQVENLIDHALMQGGIDNITVILLGLIN